MTQGMTTIPRPFVEKAVNLTEYIIRNTEKYKNDPELLELADKMKQWIDHLNRTY